VHRLSKCVLSSPTAAMTLSIMSCGISIDGIRRALRPVCHETV
jgi:hypothetical protein